MAKTQGDKMAFGDYVNSGYTTTNNAVPGVAQGISEASIYDVDTRAKFAIGTGFTRQDGNKYRYGNFITATTQGKLVSHLRADLDKASTNALIVAPAAAYQQNNETVGLYPGALGSRYIIFTLASTVKDQWQGGYITMTKDTGVGYIYRIKGNTAAATLNSVANLVIIELYEPLQVAVDATTDASITASLYNDLLAGFASAANNICVGVTCANQTANSYGWICTHGVCACLQDGTVANGDMIQASALTAGAFSTYGVGTTSNGAGILFGGQAIGYCIDQSATTQHATIYLQIE
jgi:hypothetical protein